MLLIVFESSFVLFCSPGTTPFVIYGNGSVVTPFILTSKCACGPVEYPVEPTFNIASPLFTVCPT